MSATIAERLSAIRARVGEAAVRSGRAAGAVQIVAATKSRTPDEVREALDAGIVEVGENYVQEGAAKRALVHEAATWRLIGSLQRNKAAAALRSFDAIDTVHSDALARELSRRWEQAAADAPRPPLPVLIEVHLGGEETKSGVGVADAPNLLTLLQHLPGLECQGVMTIPPPATPDQARRYFAQLRALAEALRTGSGLPLPVLSMGMSADYEAAIEEGATQVRLGTALFGPRGVARHG